MGRSHHSLRDAAAVGYQHCRVITTTEESPFESTGPKESIELEKKARDSTARMVNIMRMSTTILLKVLI